MKARFWTRGTGIWGVAVTGGLLVLPAMAQILITADDYSGFMKGNGYAWSATPPPIYSPPDPPQPWLEECGDLLVARWSGEGDLETDADLVGVWTGCPEAVPPHPVDLSVDRTFLRLRQRSALHAGVGTGCPQQGFDTTALPDDHWTNVPATPEACGWIVPEKFTGFADVIDEGSPFVRVVLRGFHQDPAGYSWWFGDYPTWQDDVIHQNDGWFHFRLRKPGGGSGLSNYLVRFQIAMDNPYAFPGGPEEFNEWWLNGFVWDWEDRSGRHLYTPMYRYHFPDGKLSDWFHFPESGVTPDPAHTTGGRSYRCLFELTTPPPLTPGADWEEIEVAQNLPYSLEDRAEFWSRLAGTYPGRYSNLCLRKRSLGMGGLADENEQLPPIQREFHELYAIEIFRKGVGTVEEPDLPNNRIAIILAGMDYEPAGNWVAEGMALEILDNWPTFSSAGSYAIIPIANPDGYEWPSTHVIPFGNGLTGDNAGIHRGYIFLEGEDEVPDNALDPEALSLRDYVRELNQLGFDGSGGSIVGMLDLENDLCPHSDRWPVPGPGVQLPPVYGYLFAPLAPPYTELLKAKALVNRLLDPEASPHTHAYFRNPVRDEGWRAAGDDCLEFGIPLYIVFEFEAAALFSTSETPPSWLAGGFSTPIGLPGISGGPDAFYVHGYIDQVGQEVAGDPAWVFKQFGRDIANALRLELME